MRFFAIVVVVLLLDQLSKMIIVGSMGLWDSIPVIPSVFHITYILNPGAAFGIMANHTYLFVLVTLAVVTAIVVGYRKIAGYTVYTRLALALIVGGALGNLIDRLRIGKVIDFLDFRIWPVFNLADTAIVIGAGLIILEVWRSESKQKK